MQAASAALAGQHLKVAKHGVVFRAGDEAERFFEVETGCVMVYRILDDGRRQVVEVVFPGGICGLASGELHESSCEALIPSVLRSYKNIELSRSEDLRARVIERLQRQMANMHEHAVSLGRKTAEERICSFVLSLRALDRAHSGEATAPFSVVLPMSRTEMADYLGLTLETVCRTLTDLVRRKLLGTGNTKSEVRILNPGRLCAAAAWDLH
jgi:CRP/FNR family transcriptional regulator